MMSESVPVLMNYLLRDLRISSEALQAVIALLEQGEPTAYIARYKRDETDSMPEEKIIRIAAVLKEQKKMVSRKEMLLRMLQSRGQLTPEIEKMIRETRTSHRLDDILAPIQEKKGKNKKGWDQEKVLYEESPVSDEEIDSANELPVEEPETAVDDHDENPAVDDQNNDQEDGATLAEKIIFQVELRQRIRDFIRQNGRIIAMRSEAAPVLITAVLPNGTDETTVNVDSDSTSENESVDRESANTSMAVGDEDVAKPLVTPLLQAGPVPVTPEAILSENEAQLERKRKREQEREQRTAAREKAREQRFAQFKEFFDHSYDLRSCSAVTAVDLLRGEQMGVLKLQLEVDSKVLIASLKDYFLGDAQSSAGHEPATQEIEFVEHLEKVLIPTMKKEARQAFFRQAQETIVAMLAKNLRQLLFRKALTRRRVLAVLPGTNRVCKLATLDEFGNLLAYDTIFLTGGTDRKSKNARKMIQLIETYNLSAIAIGNGVGSREAEQFVADIISQHFAQQDVAYIVINDVGAAEYSTGTLAKKEFPNFSSLVRAAISLGRRLQDPVAELTKIEPDDLLVGPVAPGTKLRNVKEELGAVISSAVNHIGLNLNRADETALRYVSGLSGVWARRIMEYRVANGPFRSRSQLQVIFGNNPSVYRRCAGFLRIPAGDNPLDATAIHPDHYDIACRILEQVGAAPDDLKHSNSRLINSLQALSIADLAQSTGLGKAELRLIVAELIHPGEEGSEQLQSPLFKKGTLKLEDLAPDMELIGTVSQVVDFGAFVDIGLNRAGLVHVSQMGDHFVRNAQGLLSIGQVVKVWVIGVDTQKQRISLTMISPNVQRQQRSRDYRGTEENRSPREGGADRRPAYRPPSGDRPSSGGDNRGDRNQRDNRSDSRPPRNDSSGDSRNNRDNREQRDNRSSRGPRDQRGDRGDRGDRAPRTAVAPPAPKKIVPLSDEMKKGKEPLRSFSDLAQLFGQIKPDGEE